MKLLGRGPHFFEGGGKRHSKNAQKHVVLELSYSCLMELSEGEAEWIRNGTEYENEIPNLIKPSINKPSIITNKQQSCYALFSLSQKTTRSQ